MADFRAKINGIRNLARRAPEGSSGRLASFHGPLEVAEQLVKKVKGVTLDEFKDANGNIWGQAWISKKLLHKFRDVAWPAEMDLHCRFTGATRNTLNGPTQESEGDTTVLRTDLVLEFALDGIGDVVPYDAQNEDDGTLVVRERQRTIRQGQQAAQGGDLVARAAAYKSVMGTLI